MRRALHSELTKLRTTPSTALLLLAMVAMTVGLSIAISALAAPGTTSCADGCDTTRLSLSGVYLGQTAVIVLAVLAITSEYHTGLIGTTLAATPRRLSAFAAKATAVTATVLLTGLPSVGGALLAGRILLPGNGSPPRHSRSDTNQPCAQPSAPCSTSASWPCSASGSRPHCGTPRRR